MSEVCNQNGMNRDTGDWSTPSALPVRWWLAAPDWVFRAAGLSFFGAYLAIGLQKYWPEQFWNHVPYSTLPSGLTIRMPWVPVLVDLTFLIMFVSLLVRFRPLARVSHGWVILFTMTVAFLPMIFAVWLGPLLGWIAPEWQQLYVDFLWRDQVTWQAALVGGVLITVGNVLDVWGYAVLCRSFSIVPEARVLKTTGPYRLVRHPIYLGQFVAQAGVWLCFATWHAVWIGLYMLFVALQLVRSRLEDQVLADAFGEEYQEWKQRTFWFV